MSAKGIGITVMPETNNPLTYSDHFTIFADLLGFEAAIAISDDTLRLSILKLLTDLSALKSDFTLTATPIPDQTGKHFVIRPAVSTFSDHIVISYPLERVYAELGEQTAPLVLLNQSQTLLAAIAGQALRLGFLFRGAATI